MPRTPSEDVNYQFEKSLVYGRIMGVHHFDGRLIHPRLIITTFFGIIEQIMHFHGLRMIWGDIPMMCNSFIVYFLAVELFTRLASVFLTNEDANIQSMLKTVVAFYEREEQDHNHRGILIENLKVLKYLLTAYPRLSFILYFILNPTAWILSWQTETLILFVPIYPPFLDPNTLNGYILCTLILIFYVFLVYICFMADDVMFMFFVLQCVPMIDIFCLKLREFSEELMKIKNADYETNNSDLSANNDEETETHIPVKSVVLQRQLNQPSTAKQAWKTLQTELLKKGKKARTKEIAKIESRLIEMIKEFNTYNDYVRSTATLNEYTTFAALSLNSMGIAMSIVMFLHHSKAIGFVAITLMISQVLLPCVQGSLIAKLKEKLLRELIDFPWYELSLQQQKIFLQFIHLVQNSNEFRIPIIGDLNMELFTSVMNGARAGFMYLLNFVKID